MSNKALIYENDQRELRLDFDSVRYIDPEFSSIYTISDDLASQYAKVMAEYEDLQAKLKKIKGGHND